MRKIENFMLPEHTNKLYTEEAISSMSLTRDVAKKINELVDAYNQLAEIDLTWKHEQEGRIRKGVLYMKDNLLNSLNELLNLLTNNGFFDKRVSEYTKSLETQLKNLIGSISEGSTTLDAEVIDIRCGANNIIFETAGEAIRKQLSSIINLLNNVNLLNGSEFKHGFYSIDSNGNEYDIITTGGKLRDYHEMVSDFIPVNVGKTYTASVTGINPLISDKLWLCIHSYDGNKNFVRREFAEESLQSQLDFVYTVPENVAYVRVMARTFDCASIKFEEGFFTTSFNLYEGNLIEKFPLTMSGCYTYAIDADYIIYAPAGVNLEKSTLPIDCYGKKQLNVYVEDDGATWVSINFLNSERKFVKDGTPARYIINASGKYVVDIPDDACSMLISARTLSLKTLAVFFNEEVQTDTEKVYDALFANKQLIKEALSNLSTVPPIEIYEIKDIAHRGFSWEAPENTIHAYKLAYERGFKYVECDLGFTSDNVPILLHDYTIDRTSNGTGNIFDLTYEYISTLDFGSWFSETFAGTKAMLFSEFIDLCRKLKLHPYIEVKETSTNEQLDILIDIVKRHGMLTHVTWISFGYNQLMYIVSKLPTARVGFVINTITNEAIDKTIALKTGANHVFVDFYQYTDEVIEYAITNNIPIERWSINDENEILSQHKYISGVTSDTLCASKVLKNSMGV